MPNPRLLSIDQFRPRPRAMATATEPRLGSEHPRAIRLGRSLLEGGVSRGASRSHGVAGLSSGSFDSEGGSAAPTRFSTTCEAASVEIAVAPPLLYACLEVNP